MTRGETTGGLRARRDGYFNATPLAANDLDRILDRTVGKPAQTVHHQVEMTTKPADLRAELAAILREHPETLEELGEEVRAALPIIDTTATERAPAEDQ